MDVVGRFGEQGGGPGTAAAAAVSNVVDDWGEREHGEMRRAKASCLCVAERAGGCERVKREEAPEDVGPY